MSPDEAMDRLEEATGGRSEATAVVRILRTQPDVLQALGLGTGGRQALIGVAQRLRREAKWHTERGNFVKASQALHSLATEIERKLAEGQQP